MTTTSLNSIFANIPKFDGTNWHTFQKDIEVYLQLDGIWGVISGAEKKPTDPVDLATWDKASKCGYSILYFLTVPEHRHLILDMTSGPEAWAALRSEYEKDVSASRLAL
jgi:hypothetical protein